MVPARVLSRRRHALCAVVPLAAWLGACASAPPPPVASAPPAVSVASVASPAAPPVPADPYLRVRLQPRVDPDRIVHVDLELLSAPSGSVNVLRLASGRPASLTHIVLSDPTGLIDVKATADGDGVVVTPARVPAGVVHLAYDVVANTDSPWKPLAERVLDDRFVGSGEGLLLIPEWLDDQTLPIELIIDGAAIRAPNAASTLGIGATHRTRGKPRALRHLSFIAGSLGAAVFDTSEGHDEAAWLGYTAFDPRATAAEIAGTRTAMAELFHAHDLPSETLLFVTQPRPLGSYTTTPRAGGLLVQLGPSEPWSAALRVSVAQQLIRPWLGDELWIGPHDAEHLTESYWFSEGVARFFVTRLLARIGVLRPDDVRDVFMGETSAILASPHRGKTNAELALLARTDETARAHLVARGALYAARVNALVREKSKGGWSLDTVVLELLEQARKQNGPLPVTAWTEAVDRALGGGAKEGEAFDHEVIRGEEVVLPKGVLGRCYRASTGDYVAFDLGFDAVATREGKSNEVVGLEAGGPAARAGLRAGDLVEADYRDGHPEVAAKLTVKRGTETSQLSYLPAGARRRGPVWTRIAGTPDERCEDAW